MARRRGVGRALVETAVAELRDDGARFVIAELADAPEMRFVSVLLDACGFAEEARAGDLVRDGMAMRYLVRRLAGPTRPA
jgi:GNAT superfamily N-acetyltransferase